MITFKDYLVWYNNLDVEPFVKAIEKMFEFYQPRSLDLFKDGISVPGYHEIDKTLIRGGKLCKQIWGADANALDLWALSQPMPTGYYVRWKKENNFKKEEYFNKISIEWLDYITYHDEVDTKHEHNHGKKRIGRFVVDGLDSSTNTIYELNSCYFHGHNCELNPHEFNEKMQFTDEQTLLPNS
ncbi:Zinc finger and SCAN domain-containing 22 [Paramuricea clavata]|uniref:Zinc finger and SCAN domain-containing 22 n=1 Tax=Paramuricea clavata TaxID=317549 RepID=A0A7D9HJ81_PARCT|nr:Zinc finger and SCAN domain-containing 22 [Paramuricea clavata]